ncbi:MAG: hypothetical protein IKU38_09075 [Clostridia bacterium]|nr:hypothetical protein [Clostridia bacterium]
MAVRVNGTMIQIPQGDTGAVKFVYGKAGIAQTDRAIFTAAYRGGGVVLRKVLAPDEQACAFYLPFVHAETAAMKPDTYDWSLRVVRGGTLDEDGRLAGAQSSHTAVLRGRLMILPVAGGAK